jgi:hypothetical protein
MKRIVLLISVIMLASCTSEAPDYISGESDRHQSASMSSVYKLTYFKDSRTGICFAESGIGDWRVMACVPCSEEVEKLISNEEESINK